jgi:hypothetical protein
VIAACDSVGGMPPLVTLTAPRIDRGVVTDELIDSMLAADAVVAAGISGGKDSVALGFAVWEYLDRIGHRVPEHLLYTDGWPHVMPTDAEAEQLAEMRRNVAADVRIEVQYTTGPEVKARYAELMAQNAARN